MLEWFDECLKTGEVGPIIHRPWEGGVVKPLGYDPYRNLTDPAKKQLMQVIEKYAECGALKRMSDHEEYKEVFDFTRVDNAVFILAKSSG